MLKVQTANSTYIHTGVGGPLLRVGEFLPIVESVNPWYRHGDTDYHTDWPRVGQRWEVWGTINGKLMRLNTSPVVSRTDYSSWCRRVDQPTYHLCVEHICALAKHNDVRLSTSFHTDVDCDLCIGSQDQYERGLE